MRCTDSFLVLVHLSNSESRLASLLASVCLLLYRCDFGGRKKQILSWTQYPKLPIHSGTHSITSASPHVGGIFLCALGMPLLGSVPDLSNQKSQSRQSLTSVPQDLWLHADPLSLASARYCCKKPPPTAAKVSFANALFFFWAYSAYPCRDLINSSNS